MLAPLSVFGNPPLIRPVIFLLNLLWPAVCVSQTIDVAVASNFLSAAKVLKADFEQRSSYQVNLVAGSTGKHYAQIFNGAPFDLFLAADARRPRLLEQQGRAVAGSRFSYAIGQLVLWSADPHLVDDQGKVLATDNYQRLAMANTKLAPYGRAAQQVLEALDQLPGASKEILRGENINQAFQFVHSGNAELGFVALSQLTLMARKNGDQPLGSYWLVPGHLYDAIEQQVVQLSDTPAAGAFLAYLKSPAGRKIIARSGYRLPAVGDA